MCTPCASVSMEHHSRSVSSISSAHFECQRLSQKKGNTHLFPFPGPPSVTQLYAYVVKNKYAILDAGVEAKKKGNFEKRREKEKKRDVEGLGY